MPKAYDRWTVLPHEPIEKLSDELWRVEGALPGMPVRRVMTLAKMSDERLVIHNGMALADDEMAAIEAWGTPTFLVVPNGWHRLDARVYLDRYPDLTVLCPLGSRKQVEQVVPVAGSYDDLPADGVVTLEHLDGVKQGEGVMTVRGADGATLVFNDLIFNMPHAGGLSGALFRFLLRSTGGPRITRITRWLVVKDKRALRAELERLADTPNLRRIIVSHHEVISAEPAAVLRTIAEGLS